jgi:hypothetical protein
MNRERFNQLAERAGFNPHPEGPDAEGQIILTKLVSFFAEVCEECAQTASVAFEHDLAMRITNDDARRRAVMVIRSIYSDDVLLQIADPEYVPSRLRP